MLSHKFEILAYLIPFIFGVTTFLEKVTSKEAKVVIHNWIFNTNRSSFTKYVASAGMTAFYKVFDSSLRSRRFILRSICYTIFISSLLLLVLYFSFPHIFYSALSYPINYYLESWGSLTIITVLLVFLVFDLIANMQTGYFLRIMKDSGSLPKFLAIGYADLVVTISIGILSALVAISLLIKINLHLEHTSTFSIDFTGLDTFEKSNDLTIPLPVTLHLSEREQKRKKLDRKIINKQPELSSFNKNHRFEVCDDSERYCVMELNEKGVVVRFIARKKTLSLQIDFNENSTASKKEQIIKFCNKLGQSPMVEESWFEVVNWNKNKIIDSCKQHSKSEQIKIDFKWKKEAINYSKFITTIVSNLTSLSVSPLQGDFPYFSENMAELYDQVNSSYLHSGKYTPYLTGDDKLPEAITREILRNTWKNDYSSGTMIHNSGMPWSTFFITTILTSSFIWVVIIFSAFLYPTIWLIEKIDFMSKNNYLITEKLPFTFIAGIISFWSILIILLFN